MQKSRNYIFLIELVPGGKGERVDAAEITVRRILDELFDGAYRFRLRRLSQNSEEVFGFAGKFHVTIRLITVGEGELRLGNIQVFADFSCKKIDDLAMPRNYGRLLRAPIDINRVIATFTQEFAAMLLEVAQ